MALTMVTSSAYSNSEPTGIPMAMRLTFTPERFDEAGNIDGGCFPLDGGAGGKNQFLYRAAPQALEQILELQLVGANALQRR